MINWSVVQHPNRKVVLKINALLRNIVNTVNVISHHGVTQSFVVTLSIIGVNWVARIAVRIAVCAGRS